MSKKIRFGVIGCGHIGKRHIDKITEHPKAVLTAICDNNESNLRQIDLGEGINKFNSLDDLLDNKDNFDIVSICSPSGLHKEMAVKILNQGRHVVCEKPMALTTEDCKAMISAALKNDSKLFVVKQNRYNAPVIHVKNLIDKGALGRIFSLVVNCFWNRNENYFSSVDWRGTRDIDGGPLYTQFSHFIDLIYWLNGDIKYVSGLADNFSHPTIESEDTGAVLLEFANGAIGSINYTTSCYSRNMEGSITIFAEKGTLKIGGQYLNKLDYQDMTDQPDDNIFQTKPSEDYGHYNGSMSKHMEVLDNIISTLNGDAKIGVNGIEGLKTVEIIEAIYRSVKSGRKERVL